MSSSITKRLLTHYRANSPKEVIEQAENASRVKNLDETITLLVYQQWHMGQILGELTKNMKGAQNVQIPFKEEEELPPQVN